MIYNATESHFSVKNWDSLFPTLPIGRVVVIYKCEQAYFKEIADIYGDRYSGGTDFDTDSLGENACGGINLVIADDQASNV